MIKVSSKTRASRRMAVARRLHPARWLPSGERARLWTRRSTFATHKLPKSWHCHPSRFTVRFWPKTLSRLRSRITKKSTRGKTYGHHAYSERGGTHQPLPPEAGKGAGSAFGGSHHWLLGHGVQARVRRRARSARSSVRTPWCQGVRRPQEPGLS